MPETLYLEQVRAACRASWLSPSAGELRWFGVRVAQLMPHLRRRMTAAQVEASLAEALEEQLYLNFYVAGRASPARAVPVPNDDAATRRFIARLAAANRGAGCWDPGWVVAAQPAEEGLRAEKGGLVLWVASSEARGAPATTPGSGPGQPAELRLPSRLEAASPGYFLALSDYGLDAAGWRDLVRVYWNLTPDGAVALMQVLTTRLNQDRLPFRFKVLKALDSAGRCDGAVLYLRRGDFAALRDCWPVVRQAVEGHCGDLPPALTKPLATGVGLAEDPPRSASFGRHRCRMLAAGLLAGWPAAQRDPELGLQAVLAEFSRNGVNPAAPYLNPGSADSYALPAAASRRHRAVAAPAATPATVPEDAGLGPVETACQIARELDRTAIRYHGRCSWIGPEVEAGGGIAQAALGPDLYGGTAGVGWFLAALTSVTGDPVPARLARAALAQALATAERIPAGDRWGLYAGWTGIALAAAQAGQTLRSDALLQGAHALAQRLRDSAPEDRRGDLLYGDAGAVIGLLELGRLLEDASLAELAQARAERLLARAQRRGATASWRTVNGAQECNLTGLSHGAAGIGLALLEAHAAFADPRYRAVAEQAFAYEQRWFDPAEGNWLDLRHIPRRQARPRHGVLPCACFWCHGAPGIALSRLRAWQITGEAAHRAAALVALAATRRSLAGMLAGSGIANASLCHGLAGNADVLLLADACLGGRPGDVAAAQAAAQAALRCHAGPGAPPWPCGFGGGGAPPGLMLGISGIGLFLLRSRHPELPSPLLPRLRRAPSRTPAGERACPA